MFEKFYHMIGKLKFEANKEQFVIKKITVDFSTYIRIINHPEILKHSRDYGKEIIFTLFGIEIESEE